MTKVHEKYGSAKLVGALVGIELEVEGENFPRSPSLHPSWDMKADGSLRNGVEFVLKTPMSAKNSKLALEEVASAFATAKTKPDYSFRTSTHVHLNMSNLELDQLNRTVVLYYLAERIYLDYCAPTRKGNRFCLGLKDAEGILDQVKELVTRGIAPRIDRGKYTSLNLCPLTSFGTIEFRSLEGTDDWNKIYSWVLALLRLRKAGRELETQATDLWKLSNQEVVDRLFPLASQKEKFLKPGWEADMDYQRSLLAPIWG